MTAFYAAILTKLITKSIRGQLDEKTSSTCKDGVINEFWSNIGPVNLRNGHLEKDKSNQLGA
jgi:hypothetical protein